MLLGSEPRRGENRRADGLGNRRALADDLPSAIAEPPGEHELLLAMFDLDGFKQYNDTFGHAAGDALLQRLGGRLAAAPLGTRARAYRMGGDEFCVLARCSSGSRRGDCSTTRVAALEDSGEGWHIGCSQGAGGSPPRQRPRAEALKLADERMYANKTGRSSASRQVTDVLLQVLSEQDTCLDDARRARRRARGRGRRSARRARARGAADPPRREAARHRQDRDPGRDPRQARAARRAGVGVHAPPHR